MQCRCTGGGYAVVKDVMEGSKRQREESNDAYVAVFRQDAP